MIMKLLRSWQAYIAQLHRLILAAFPLMRELAGDDPEKIRKIEEWKFSVVAVIAEQSVKDGEDLDRLSTY